MTCRLGGECDLVSRDSQITPPGPPGVYQCRRCSLVYIVSEYVPRVCGHCGLTWGESLHDPCLGTLEGVAEACCGHGDQESAYVHYADGRRLIGKDVPWLSPS